ncbi:phage portal protein [Clostridium botulinum]|uniref:Phage portal protein, SPP1 family n=1 Tax=Clostridium botulinum (strain Langeland / NCTC 10281 / Type F) TaxID=441772 RepID=A7GFV2_CLOBL|nr:phage portal protein [Clostridium botulinum]ABS39328.1 phage portal protein, SPP1 family [Clostridium botulinum F str. Langeland]ADG00072.1 phage portal protein, SPP1 family [Clostridium botulinum F str. 230613]KKM42377.1 portal protein [Clostridium botulinum]MBY6793142.1 phage portal protein [Clostridium botulinum]MBY6937352.1 phage portal protein [Clostridium botulinum]
MFFIDKILSNGSNSVMSLEEIIQEEIKEWNSSQTRQLMLDGERYYKGDTDILKRKRMAIGEDGELEEVKNLANNKLVHQFVRKLADQKVGYLLSKPLSVQTDNETYKNVLDDIFNKSFMRLLKNLGKDAINKGIAWAQIYYNSDGELRFKRLPSEEIIPLWKDSEHTKLDALIRVYEVIVYEGKTKKTVQKVEYWDTKQVLRYINDNGKLITDVEAPEDEGHFSIINKDGTKQSFTWSKVPFIYFKYNDEEQPLIKFVKSLVDDYDRNKSDNSNNLEDLPNSIYVLKDYDGTNLGEFRKNMSLYRAVKVTGDGGVETRNLEINVEAYKTHIEQTRKDIYEFGRGVDTQSDKFGNSPSGIALKFLYNDLDMDCNIIETEFQASLEYLLWFVNQHLINTGQGDFTNENVEFVFNRDTLINETDSINNCQSSVGIISDETIVANHPWATKDELEKIKKQKEERESMYPNFPLEETPEDEEDEENEE